MAHYIFDDERIRKNISLKLLYEEYCISDTISEKVQIFDKTAGGKRLQDPLQAFCHWSVLEFS
jgi:hypothetical protein